MPLLSLFASCHVIANLFLDCFNEKSVVLPVWSVGMIQISVVVLLRKEISGLTSLNLLKNFKKSSFVPLDKPLVTSSKQLLL